jgi:uroporphyrinogen decarboxylase
VDRLRRFDPRAELGYVFETIRLLRRELTGKVPLIGFAGAPFTLAAYAIEGGPSTSYIHTKSFMYSQPQAWHRLCERLADTVADFLTAQVEAGAQALQIFDSWAGALGRGDYREFALPHTKSIFDRVAGTGVPLIHFGVGASTILTDLAEAGGDVIGLDWREPLDEGWARVPDRGVQGNLDPALLLGPTGRMLGAAREVLTRAGGRPGHIFNLGHGIQPPTPLEHVQELARFVHQETRTGPPQ